MDVPGLPLPYWARQCRNVHRVLLRLLQPLWIELWTTPQHHSLPSSWHWYRRHVCLNAVLQQPQPNRFAPVAARALWSDDEPSWVRHHGHFHHGFPGLRHRRYHCSSSPQVVLPLLCSRFDCCVPAASHLVHCLVQPGRD